jgi:hypothetical protein
LLPTYGGKNSSLRCAAGRRRALLPPQLGQRCAPPPFPPSPQSPPRGHRRRREPLPPPSGRPCRCRHDRAASAAGPTRVNSNPAALDSVSPTYLADLPAAAAVAIPSRIDTTGACSPHGSTTARRRCLWLQGYISPPPSIHTSTRVRYHGLNQALPLAAGAATGCLESALAIPLSALFVSKKRKEERRKND